MNQKLFELIHEHLRYEVSMMQAAGNRFMPGQVFRDQTEFNIYHTTFWTHARNCYSFFEGAHYREAVLTDYHPKIIDNTQICILMMRVQEQVLSITLLGRTAVMDDKLQMPRDSEIVYNAITNEYWQLLAHLKDEYKKT